MLDRILHIAGALVLLVVALLWAAYWYLGAELSSTTGAVNRYTWQFFAVAALALLPLGAAIYLFWTM